jgi:pantetheine-phosphate adenylyltransferase
MEPKPITAIFPGSFDPITRGHWDVICRGNKLFDRVIVAVGQNPDKRELFSKPERVEMIRNLVKDMPSVSVESYD